MPSGPASPALAGRASTDHSEIVSPRQRALVFGGAMLGMLLAALDQTIVGTAMPRIIAELNGLQQYAWVFTAYMLSSTVMVPIYGKLSDLYGRRPFFLGGMLLFLLGSALSGMSQDMTQLIVFRAVQGLGAGALLPIVQAIVGDLFPPAERGKWSGLIMGVWGLSSIVGPTAGGWITDHWGWRWVFYVNMPVGAVAIATAALALPRHSRHRQHQVDYLGAATLVGAAVPLLLAFSWAGTEYPWGSSQVVGLLVLAAALSIAFFVIEARAAEPIINPSLFKNGIYSVSVLATCLTSAGMFGAIMYLPLFVQGVIGESATEAGAVMTPMMLGFVTSSIVGGQLMARTGRYKLLALGGFALGTLGMWLLSGMGADATREEAIRNMVVTGLGLGVTMSLFVVVVQNAFPAAHLGQATASLVFFRSIGGTISVAILGSVMTNNFQAGLRASLPPDLRLAMPPGRLEGLQNPQVLLHPATAAQIQAELAALGPSGQALFEQLLAAIRVSLAGAIAELFAVGTAMLVLAFIATLFLREIPLRGRR